MPQPCVSLGTRGTRLTRIGTRWQKPPDEIPVPRIASESRSWVLQRFELKSFWRKPDLATIGEQSSTVRRDQVRHRVPLPDMAVQP